MKLLLQLLQNRAEVNAINEHGNTALHYATFWGYGDLADDLVSKFGALVSITNKDGDTPLDKAKGALSSRIHGMSLLQMIRLLPFKDHVKQKYQSMENVRE